MVKLVNLNADMGESFGAYSMGNDQAMLDLVGSANIACGYHAADPLVMMETVGLANERGVSLGAHPSFPDLQGFGRRKMYIPAAELEAMIIYQIGALTAIAKANGSTVTHVKPHGALNNMASIDLELSSSIAKAIKAADPDLILLAPATSCLYIAGVESGLKTAGEIFADRTYDDDGNLTPRSQPNAIIHDPKQAADQVLSFLNSSKLITQSGKEIDAKIHSICVHGDSANAIDIARAVKDRLTEHGYQLAALPEVIRNP